MILDKICQVIMLPTKDDPDHKLWLNKETNSLWFDDHGKVSSRFEAQHLYILSDDEINYDDWFYSFNDGNLPKGIYKCDKYYKYISNYLDDCKKIIGTTDKSLKVKDNSNDDIDDAKWARLPINLPDISPSFIQYFVEEWKLKNIIKSVNVKYEILNDVSDNYEIISIGEENIKLSQYNEFLHLKVDRNNYLIINKIVELYYLKNLCQKDKKLRDEVISLCVRARDKGKKDGDILWNEWIKTNLI